jgi:hypothetical protein
MNGRMTVGTVLQNLVSDACRWFTHVCLVPDVVVCVNALAV